MVPYSDNLIHGEKRYGVISLIIIMCAINVPMLTDPQIASWMIRFLGFIPLNFSLSPWKSLYTLVTSIFLHSDTFHLLGNFLFLWVFGRSLERLFGTVLFLIAFPLLSITGLLLHWIIYPDSLIPVIGSSGSIATLMGAYLTLFPEARMKMVIFLGIFFKRFTVPAWIFLFYWGSLQLLSLIFGTGDENNVAYAVHMGGFIFGIIAAIIWKVSYPFAEETLISFTETSFSPTINK